MIEVKRKKGESFESFLRRFKKRVIQSGIILQYKKVRFRQKAANKYHRKKSALFRKAVNAKREYLRKIGRLPEEEMTPRQY